MTTPRAEFFMGIRDELPILLGTIPFGLIYGVSARSFGTSPVLTQAMSLLVFAGSAQFVTVQLLGAGVPLAVILLTAIIINLRHALYSASLAPYLKPLGFGWRILLPYLLTDEVYAVTITHYQQPGPGASRHWYFLGAGLVLWSTWQTGTAVGLVLGAHIPASWSLDFALPLTFIALVVPALKRGADGIAAGLAGIVAVLAAGLPFNSGLLIATFVGITAGMFFESRGGKQPANHEREGSVSSQTEPVQTLLLYPEEECEQ